MVASFHTDGSLPRAREWLNSLSTTSWNSGPACLTKVYGTRYTPGAMSFQGIACFSSLCFIEASENRCSWQVSLKAASISGFASSCRALTLGGSLVEAAREAKASTNLSASACDCGCTAGRTAAPLTTALSLRHKTVDVWPSNSPHHLTKCSYCTRFAVTLARRTAMRRSPRVTSVLTLRLSLRTWLTRWFASHTSSF